MPLLDGLAFALLAFGFAAFALGGVAVAHGDDLPALYWLVIGLVATRSAVHVARPRGA